MSTQQAEVHGGGPWTFETASALGPGETFHVTLRDERVANQRGYLKKFLPMDGLKVYNLDTAITVEAEVNGVHTFPIPPNSSEPFNDVPVHTVHVKNPSGSASIDAGNVRVVVTKDGWDADKAARRRRESPLPQAVANWLPGGT